MVPTINGLFSYELFGQTLWITTTHVTLFIVLVALLSLALVAHHKIRKHPDEVPGVFQNILELIVEKLDSLVQGAMGANAHRYRNFIGTLFAFILVSNLGGIFGLRPVTADFGTTFALGLTSFFVIQISAIKAQKWRYITSFGKPYFFLAPSNIIGDVSTPISLGLRLFANILSGTMIMGLWYGMLGWISLFPLSAFLEAYLDIFSACIQTYVFTMLTMTYINDKIS